MLTPLEYHKNQISHYIHTFIVESDIKNQLLDGKLWLSFLVTKYGTEDSSWQTNL